MYSLYGVVVHSGGMQDGHYVAYTKTRTTSTFASTSTKTTATPNQKEAIPSDSEKQSSNSELNVESTGEEVADSCSPKAISKTTATPNQQEAIPSDSKKQTSNSEVNVESPTTPTDGQDSCSPKAFDYSSADGQWYYASDSHVRTATESEVMRSQAYLLFYERLPFLA